MNEKEAITSVVAIGANTHRYLEKIKELMTLEETDVRDWNEMFEYGKINLLKNKKAVQWSLKIPLIREENTSHYPTGQK